MPSFAAESRSVIVAASRAKSCKRATFGLETSPLDALQLLLLARLCAAQARPPGDLPLRLATQARQVDLRHYARLARLRFEGGYTSYLEVLDDHTHDAGG